MASVTTASPQHAKPGYRELFAVHEYTAIFAAQLLSILGDQLARVALTVLVYARTGSPLLAAVTFAASLLPAMAGGMLGGQLADRYPRRTVMIACDLASAALVAVMALPGMPPAALIALIAVVAAVSGPFTSARAALTIDILQDRGLYPLGSSVNQTAYMTGQFAGYAAAGLVIAAAGVRGGLAIDAATFAASAILIAANVTRRPAPSKTRRREPLLAGVRVILAARVAAVALGLELVLCVSAAAEGTAVPLARQLGGGATAAGLLLASMTAGAAVSMTAAGRWGSPAARSRTVAPMACLSAAWLVLFAFRPPLPAAIAYLAAAGLCSGYMIATNAAFARAIADEDLGKASGAANAAMLGVQAAVIVAAGALAGHIGASATLAIAGAAGVLAAVPLGVAWGRVRPGTA